MTIYQGGFKTYGHPIGILMLDGRFPRIPGDMGNATTFNHPVIYHVIAGAPPRRVVDGDPALLEPFLEGARYLERSGARMITTNCGFLAVFQREMAAAVNVPVYTSSLIQVPLVWNMLGHGKKVGILTADGKCLTEAHFRGVGWSRDQIPAAIQGMEDYPAFTGTILGNGETLDFEAIEEEMGHAARKLIREHPGVGAIVFECTNMPPYASHVQQVTGLPVFDILTLTDMAYRAAIRSPYRGHM